MNDSFSPLANFTGMPTTGTVPLTVQFTETSTNNPTSWSWAFGDGGTSTDQNATHTYTAAGTYDVSLRAANAGGNDTKVKAGYVVVTSSGYPAILLPKKHNSGGSKERICAGPSCNR